MLQDSEVEMVSEKTNEPFLYFFPVALAKAVFSDLLAELLAIFQLELGQVVDTLDFVHLEETPSL